MQKILHRKTIFSSGMNLNEQHDSRISYIIPSWISDRRNVRFSITSNRRISLIYELSSLKFSRNGSTSDVGKIRVSDGNNRGEMSDEDEDLCPVECVREFKTDEEFLKVIEKAKGTGSLVVVDFYRTSCGSCKYIEQGFAKLCKGSGDQEASVIFLKHNVIDEYDEQSEVAERLRIKSVPLFHFYRDGILLEAFPTRDKERILEAIHKYTSAS